MSRKVFIRPRISPQSLQQTNFFVCGRHRLVTELYPCFKKKVKMKTQIICVRFNCVNRFDARNKLSAHETRNFNYYLRSENQNVICTGNLQLTGRAGSFVLVHYFGCFTKNNILRCPVNLL